MCVGRKFFFFLFFFIILDSLFSFTLRLCYISRHVSFKAINTWMIYVLADHPINRVFGVVDSSDDHSIYFIPIQLINLAHVQFSLHPFIGPRFYILLYYYLHNLIESFRVSRDSKIRNAFSSWIKIVFQRIFTT